MSKTGTKPPHTKHDSTLTIIFPFKGNEDAVDSAAINFGIVAYPKKNILIYSGTQANEVRKVLIGGVCG